MNFHYLPSDQSTSLIILFLGWGCPAGIFGCLRKPGYDILMIDDYRDFSASDIDKYITGCLEVDRGLKYREFVVVGWSFGVRMGSAFLKETSLDVTLRLAVNGTPSHIDDERGIPRKIFDGTLEGLTEVSLRKFRLRCAGSKEWYDGYFSAVEPEEYSLDSWRSQLAIFGDMKDASTADFNVWDKAVIGMADRIFPPANQIKAWVDADRYCYETMPHLPDFQKLLDTFVIDKERVAGKFAETTVTYRDNATVQHQVAARLHNLLMAHAAPIRSSRERVIMELGYGDGTFTEAYAASHAGMFGTIRLCDIKQGKIEQLMLSGFSSVEYVTADVESADFADKYLQPGTIDRIYSSSMFQWLNSPCRMLEKCCRALKPGGVIALSFYGEDTFREIAVTVGSGLKYPSARMMAGVATGAGCRVEILSEDTEVIEFDTAVDALKHLKLTGVNALPGKPDPGRARQLLREWPLDNAGHATLTFNPIYMIITRPEDNNG